MVLQGCLHTSAVTMSHFRPPDNLQTVVELDKEVYKMEKKLHGEATNCEKYESGCWLALIN